MIWIPTITTCRQLINEDYCLYSPSLKNNKIVTANKITIWDNHTFYLLKKLISKDRQEIAYQHYMWFINFIKENYQEGITLITPDVDWLDKGGEIEELWLKNCKDYPQLYVPYTWRSDIGKLNIIGNAIRKDQPSDWYHIDWTHCLGHIRNNIPTKLLTYDASRPLN